MVCLGKWESQIIGTGGRENLFAPKLFHLSELVCTWLPSSF